MSEQLSQKFFDPLSSLANIENPFSRDSSKPNFDFSGILDSVAKNPRDRYYKDQQISLDGYSFTNCCFNNCEFFSDAGIFAFNSCVIMPTCKIYFGPNALRIIKLFHIQFPYPSNTVYKASLESHGSITIE